jgi:hypothetical protein
MTFQTQVYNQPGFAIAGDFASANPRWTVNAGPGGIVAGASLFVGRFAWTTGALDSDGAATVANSFGAGSVTGFLHREQQGLITNYLQEASMQVPIGFQVSLASGGDFWVKNDGATQALIGQKAYANLSNGKVNFAVTGAPLSGGSGTASSIAAETFSTTGSIANNVMTVTAVGSGTVYPGVLVTSGAATGTQVLSQLTGTTGGIGTYQVSPSEQTVTSTTLSGTYGLLTVGGTLTGTFGVGDVLSGSGGGGVTTGTTITALGTGTGGAGTYVVQTTQTVTSSTISATSTVETKWVAMSSGLAGELVKISDHLLG